MAKKSTPIKSNFNLANHALLASFNVTRPKLSKVDKALTDEQKSMHGVTGRKTLHTIKDFYGDELKGVEAAIWDARKDHYFMTLGWVADGAQLLTSKMYMTYTTKMREHRQRVADMVNALDYQQIIARRAIALNGTFNRDEYPDEQTFKDGYSISISLIPVPESSTFNNITELIDDEINTLIAANEQRMADATQTAMQSAWEKLYDVVKNVADKLKAGECTKVYDSLIGNVVDIINILPMLNVTDDPRMNDLSDKIKASICEVTTDELKGDQVKQIEVGTAAQNILDLMSSYMGVMA